MVSPKSQRVATRQDGRWVQEGLRQCAADGKIGLERRGGRGEVDMAGTGCDRVRLQPEIKVTLPTKPFPIESQPNSTQRAWKFGWGSQHQEKAGERAFFPSQSSDLMTLFSCCSESGFDGWTRGYLIVGAGYQLWEPATQLWEEASKSCPAENSPPHYWRPSRFRKGPMYIYDLLYECTWGGLQVISRWFFLQAHLEIWIFVKRRGWPERRNCAF